MQAPLTALGVISDGARLSKYYPKMPAIVWPATDISAHESNNTVSGAVLVDDSLNSGYGCTFCLVFYNVI